MILPDVISKEPLGPLVRQGDARFADVVRWMHFLLLAAEEFGITQANVAQMMNDPRPEVQRMLGRGGDLGKMLGLDNAWGGERHQGGGQLRRDLRSPPEADRHRSAGRTTLWTKGGLQYSPPFR